MTKEAIVTAASKVQTTRDFLNLLNKIKMDDLGDKGHPFIMPHLNYFIHPARNKKSYKEFRIPKKTGGFRVISAPKALLKSFLTYTNKLLQAFYDAPDYVTGFVPEKSVVDNAEKHIGMNYVFNTDLQDFFPSISKSRVWATLKFPPFNFNDTVADAISGLCCTEIYVNGETRRALPQGSPCSPILTNIVCRNLDRRLHRLAKEYNLRFSRYADDITFSSNRNVFQKGSEFRNKLEGIITEQHFIFNEKKTRLQTKCQRQEVTGLIVSDRVNVTREFVRELDNLLFIWEKYGEADAYAKFLLHYTPKQNFHSYKPNMQAVIQGKLLYIKMVKGADNEVWRRLQRRFNKLSGAKPSTVEATLKYKYTIADFEKKIGQALDFELNKDGVIYCTFSLNGKKTSVALSHYVRTRISNILAKSDTAALEKFKTSYMLVFYEQDNTNFWRIERKRTWVKTNLADLIDTSSLAEALLSASAISEKGDELTSTPMKSTDEVLAALVDSDFDLKILDEWDKIRSS
ncbi:MAG: RNA-directed DNA polymerase [Bacteroidales bacterium]|nr:RNA-directed DNA polymerase [Bacteroidales bacterium]